MDTEAQKYGNRLEFPHKKYPRIVITYDKGNLDDDDRKGGYAFSKTDHWHRYNPLWGGSKKDKYLDAKGKPVYDGHPDSHIY